MQHSKTLVALSLAVATATLLSRPAAADLNFSPAVGLAIKAEMALNEDNPQRSIEFGQKALKSMDLSPSYAAYVRNNMCVAYTQITRFEMALMYCKRALQFDPHDWRFLNSRANALLGMGDADSAIADYSAALKERPNNAILQNNLEIAKKYKHYGGVPLSFSQRRLRL